MKRKLVSVVIAFVPLAACASDPPPPASTPESTPQSIEAPPARPQSSDIVDLATSDESKAALRNLICKPDSLTRQCFAIPDDATCASEVDAAWPACANGLVIHVGKNSEDYETGRKVGRCISLGISKKFAGTPTDGCKSALAKSK